MKLRKKHGLMKWIVDSMPSRVPFTTLNAVILCAQINGQAILANHAPNGNAK